MDAPTLHQPWKAHWPPKTAQAAEPFKGMGFEAGAKIVMDGSSLFPSTTIDEGEKEGEQPAATNAK